MKSKSKFPKKILVVRTCDVADDPILICNATPEDIGEEFADEPVAVYELTHVGKFSVEKSVDAKATKKR